MKHTFEHTRSTHLDSNTLGFKHIWASRQIASARPNTDGSVGDLVRFPARLCLGTGLFQMNLLFNAVHPGEWDEVMLTA
jgi:hypothetical protein